MGGVIITLTRGMGEPTYCLSLTRCCSIRLGGLFGGRVGCFCTEDLLDTGLCCGDFFTVSTILVCV